jgi:hypothetical protein
MRFCTIRAALAAALLLSGAAAQAATASATASFSNLRTTVIDLTPGDGQAAGISFAPDHSSLSVQMIAHGAWVAGTGYRYGNSGVADSFSVADSSTGVGFASRDGSPGNVYAHSVAPQSALPGSNETGSNSQYLAKLTFAAHTAATLTMNMDIQLATDGNAVSSAGAYADIGVSTLDSREVWDKNRNVEIVGSNQQFHLNKDFTFNYSNDSDAAVTFWFFTNVSADTSGSYNGHVPIDPVPEPSSYAMLGVGLALMGALARKRKQG